MAIHPEYADAILEGRKQIEFRKRPVAQDVTTVVIYATSPISSIVGEFSVGGVVVDTPARLWSQFHGVGCIERTAFDGYYGAAESAAGIRVDAAHRYPTPVPLATLKPAPAVPQSFAYLSEDLVEQIRPSRTPSATLGGSIRRAVNAASIRFPLPRRSSRAQLPSSKAVYATAGPRTKSRRQRPPVPPL